MDLYVLMGQRTERYEGEYGLEALAVASEADRDGNPEYMSEQMQRYRDSGEFDALAIVTLRVSGEAMRAVLYPNTKPVQAAVIGAAER